jgi:hypothetical protein
MGCRLRAVEGESLALIGSRSDIGVRIASRGLFAPVPDQNGSSNSQWADLIRAEKLNARPYG